MYYANISSLSSHVPPILVSEYYSFSLSLSLRLASSTPLRGNLTRYFGTGTRDRISIFAPAIDPVTDLSD